MKKFRFLFVVAVIAAIFVVPSFAAVVETSGDGLVFVRYKDSNYRTVCDLFPVDSIPSNGTVLAELDGKSVICWDGSTDGLTYSSTYGYLVSSALPVEYLEDSFAVLDDGLFTTDVVFADNNLFEGQQFCWYASDGYEYKEATNLIEDRMTTSFSPGLYFKYKDAQSFTKFLVFTPPDPMGEIMDSTTSIFDSGLSMMSSVANAVTSSPLILLIVLIPLIFVGVSLFRRFLKI